MVSMRIPARPSMAAALTAGNLAASVVLGSPATGVPAAPTDPAVDMLLQQRLDNPRLGDDVGMVVIDGATGTVVSSNDPDALMLPASNMKIVTAVNVLATMAPADRFVTRVRAGATATDIVLEGAGDPLLTTSDLQALARATAERLTAGSRVTVHVDDDLFPDTGRGPGWTTGYIPYVAAPVTALARLGDYSSTPARNAAGAFTRELRAAGVKARMGDDADAGRGAAVLAQTAGHTVGEAVKAMLSRSENNVAEVMYRHVAVATGVEASWQGAQLAAESTLRGLGLSPDRMRILDGSGLSRKDRLSPRFLAEVLRLAKVTRPARFTLMFEPDALPVAGRTGTLATDYGRYASRPSRCARGDVQAKTGSLFDTISLSGVADTESGDERLFSILVNDRPQQVSALSTRQAVDGLAATITGCWD